MCINIWKLVIYVFILGKTKHKKAPKLGAFLCLNNYTFGMINSCPG
ncbi:MAG: hypothetical protein ACI828_001263 [Flavobacteriales bacterium]|jgi:hypothetical protein